MADQSQLLDAAEKVCLLFKGVCDNVTGDQMEAAKALIQMTVAINLLAVEVKKGQDLLAGLAELKKQLEPVVGPPPEENQAPAAGFSQIPPTTNQTTIDPTKILETIFSSLNLPQNQVKK